MSLIRAKIIQPPKLKTKFKGCIYLGVPKSRSQMVKGKDSNSRVEFTNADILFILEHGSPARNIVPRPLLSSVLKLHQVELKDALYNSIPIVMTGSEDEIDVYFERLALKIQGWTQMFMVREGQQLWKPSIRVLRAQAKGKQAKTMIDTGSLRQSIIAFYSKDGDPNA